MSRRKHVRHCVISLVIFYKKNLPIFMNPIVLHQYSTRRKCVARDASERERDRKTEYPCWRETCSEDRCIPRYAVCALRSIWSHRFLRVLTSTRSTHIGSSHVRNVFVLILGKTEIDQPRPKIVLL